MVTMAASASQAMSEAWANGGSLAPGPVTCRRKVLSGPMLAVPAMPRRASRVAAMELHVSCRSGLGALTIDLVALGSTAAAATIRAMLAMANTARMIF